MEAQSPKTETEISAKMTRALESIRDNLLRPMHDSIIQQTNQKTDDCSKHLEMLVRCNFNELSTKIDAIEKRTKEADDALIQALSGLKW